MEKLHDEGPMTSVNSTHIVYIREAVTEIKTDLKEVKSKVSAGTTAIAVLKWTTGMLVAWITWLTLLVLKLR